METNFQADGNVLEMTEQQEQLVLLRTISDRLTRIETLVEVHLGKDGTVPGLVGKVERINGKILMATGAGGLVIFLADWVKAAVFGK